MARRMPLPFLKPTLQLGVHEPEVRVEVVGEDGVLGAREPSGTALDFAGQELLGHALEGCVDQVVDVRVVVAEEVENVVQLGGVEQGKEKVGIEVAAVEQRVNEAVCVLGGNSG